MIAAATYRAIAVAALLLAVAGPIVCSVLQGLRAKGASPSSVPRAERGWPVALLGVGVALSAGTALWGVLGGGELRGWLLLAHSVAAPVLIVAMVLYAVFTPTGGVLRLGVLAAGLVTLGAMAAAMSPVFGYSAQLRWLDAHRYGGLALVVLATWQVYAAASSRHKTGNGS